MPLGLSVSHPAQSVHTPNTEALETVVACFPASASEVLDSEPMRKLQEASEASSRVEPASVRV
ncbi:hypothetical protein PGTUg99_017920 [Puccinia graminis f. sp. tritici]|uniref:Uncharacterized protein n=1 Tax=Puccinia graminis f. sp. tritici TaxID=56615 RepID=A0A5B0M7M8_PUCGR|nr:hypothetical protein PGTUg99_017920 [Puccinia graminis f. sp. tritici]